MSEAIYIEVSAEVRYWDDARLNGVPDDRGEVPCRRGALWEPVIELATGQILGWPSGLQARIHYKVCDAGEYWLQDASRTRIAKWKGFYVPDDILCVGDNGYGDYIIFNIGDDGKIVGWTPPPVVPENWVPVQ